ncbi:hypothetical protein EW146_g9465 [Bondarzewia mesenterica]|uniref:Uncharacterized protein n=1 Tax=Bondarzewia mesenterica TaxID=1095465 RepID=A0A4V3XCR3_9AGAM|nr:hypothetical protein EW146_g9465 [Bondarzewia mesenterica]
MQLWVQCDSMMRGTDQTMYTIYNGVELTTKAGFKKPTFSTFHRWTALGCKYAAVASGGSIYALVLVAGQEKRHAFGLIDGNTHWNLANILRSPKPDIPAGKVVIDSIIPAIATLRKLLPLTMAGIFSSSVLMEHGLQNDIPCANFDASDQFFSIMKFNNFSLFDRQKTIWASCYLEEIGWLMKFGQRERERAQNAVAVESLIDLKDKLQDHYKDGARCDAESYLRIPIFTFQDALRMDNDDGSLLAFICSAMPSAMCSSLKDNLLACFEPHASLMDTNSEDTSIPSTALHFSWYNRHCTQGTEAPTGVPPCMMQRSHASKMNYHQFIPYTSKEMQDHPVLYARVKELFAQVFEWIHDTLASCLPKEYEILRMEADVLPGNNRSAVYPFLGLVINLNVTTRAHRDAKDKDFCLVLPIGDTTHFNLHYKGRRASLVLQTDREMRHWREDRNGWMANQTLH